MADSSLYLWHEDPTVEGRKELVRKLYGQEFVEAQCLEHFDGSTAIVLAARIHLETGLTPSNLARAWKQLRIRYPLIATRTKPLQPEDPIALFNMTYTSPASDSEADEWINQTLVQSWMPPNVSLQAFAADLASANLFPLSKGVYAAQLHYVKASSDEMLLGIVSAHHATDGMQSLYYLDELCKHLSAGSDIPEPSWGSEIKSLKPPLSIELGLRTPSNDVPTDLEQFVASRMELMAGPNVQLPTRWFAPGVPPKPHQIRQSFHLNKDNTQRLIQTFKSHGLTVTEGMSTVLTLAECAMMDRIKPGFLTEGAEWLADPMNIMDCRPNPNYNGLSMAMALIRARTSDLQTVLNESRKGADERPEVSTAFWNLAEFIKSEWRREKGLKEDILRFAQESSVGLLVQGTTPEGPVLPPSLSNIPLGIIEDRVQEQYGDGRLSVLDLCMTVRVHVAMLVCHYWTFKGELSGLFLLCSPFWSSADASFVQQETNRWLAALSSA